MRFALLLLAGALACRAPLQRTEAAEAREAADLGQGQSSEVRREAAASGSGQQSATTLTDRHDFRRPTARFDLPGRLDEISGLAFTTDGRLFAHDDERGRVHEIDPASGRVGKRFDLGQNMARDDFEGIAIAGERFFLVSSQGWLYEFREMDDGRPGPYRVTDTGVGARCEVEGLDYDRALDALLLACKVAVPDRRSIVVHRLPLDPAAPRLQPLVVAKSQLGRFGLDAEFDASAIAVDPNGTLVLVSGPGQTIIEVDRSGTVLAAYELSDDRHPQPEGVAFGPDGALYVADERNGDDAYLTVYARTEDGGAAPR